MSEAQFFFFLILLLIWEREEVMERGNVGVKDKHTSCLTYVPDQGSNPQPRYGDWTTTFWCMGQSFSWLSHPARAKTQFLICLLLPYSSQMEQNKILFSADYRILSYYARNYEACQACLLTPGPSYLLLAELSQEPLSPLLFCLPALSLPPLLLLLLYFYVLYLFIIFLFYWLHF